MNRQLRKDFYRMFVLWYPTRLPAAAPAAPQKGGAQP